MANYSTFFGVDVAKKHFDVRISGQKKTYRYTNNLAGFTGFVDQHKESLGNGLVGFETTGGYEWELAIYLRDRNIAVHRGDTLKIKNFIQSIRRYGKTDKIDAECIAEYVRERHAHLKLFEKPDDKQLELQLLIRRRDTLVRTRTQESNRAKSPMNSLFTSLEESSSSMLQFLSTQIAIIDAAIQQLIKSDSDYNEKKKIMMSLKGIGEITANKLLALFPEIGTMTGKAIANMAGVAPHPYDSGSMKGYRKTRGGREGIKSALYMAAMAASKSNGKFGDFYKSLTDRGKKPLIAFVALMRKMIVVLNALIREFLKNKEGKEAFLSLKGV